MKMHRSRILILALSAASVAIYFIFQDWSAEQQLSEARTKISSLLSSTSRSILISYNESTKIPLLGAEFEYELQELDSEAQIFDGMQLQITATGRLDSKQREIFEGAFVDLTRPSGNTASIGEFLLTPSGDLLTPAGKIIYHFDTANGQNPYGSKVEEILTLPPISFVRHDNFLEIIGLGIPETMAEGGSTSWRKQIELIVRKDSTEGSKVLAQESFEVLLAEKFGPLKQITPLPWHCVITNEADLRDQQAASAPVLWQDCELSCTCKVSAKKKACLSSGLIELTVALLDPLCGHPTPAAPDLAELSCTAQAHQTEQQLEICSNACTSLRVQKDIEVEIAEVLRPRFLGCKTYQRSPDERLPRYCNIRQNRTYRNWKSKQIVPFNAYRALQSEPSKNNPLASIEASLETCLKDLGDQKEQK